MRVALTGAAGFIGRHVGRLLEMRGDTVFGSDLDADQAVQGLDLRDGAAVSSWLRASRPDVVVHAGAISGAMVAGGNPDLVHAVNVGGTSNLLVAMAELGIGQLVFLSSIAVYAPRADRMPVDEASALASQTSYGRSKIEAEHLIGAAVARGALRGSSVLRISSVYGRGRKTPYLISNLVQCAAAGRPADVTDETSNMRQFIHVDDCARAVVLALQRPMQGVDCFNVTGGSYVSELDIAKLAATYLEGLTWRIVSGKQPDDGQLGPLDISRARRLIGYEPEISLERGLALTLSSGSTASLR